MQGTWSGGVARPWAAAADTEGAYPLPATCAQGRGQARVTPRPDTVTPLPDTSSSVSSMDLALTQLPLVSCSDACS